MFRGEIISVGTELLLGQISNTNSQYISKRMAEIGCSIYFHVTVGDNSDRLGDVITQATSRSNLIVFTGGLGPTHDDITKEVFCKIVNKNLILDEFTYKKMVQYFQERNITMSKNNKKQAMVIEACTIFFNENGLAPGMGIKIDDIYYIFLPGPPTEMNPMLDNYVIPWLKNIIGNMVILSETMRFVGIGESTLDEKISDLIEGQDNPTVALLAEEGEVLVRLTAKGENNQEALNFIKPVEDEIHKRLAKYHYSNGVNSIEYVVLDLLKRLNLTISISESCTGGLVGDLITRHSGSSSVYKGGVICYNNSIKIKILNVPLEILNSKGAVSKEVAKALAENTAKIFNTDLGVSITGIAGPRSVENKPVGLIYIGIAEKNKTKIYQLNLSGKRTTIKTRAAKHVFYYLWCILKGELNNADYSN